MSAGGLSFVTFSESKLFKTGLKIDDLKVFIDGELYKSANGEIAYQNNFMDLKGSFKQQIGVKFLEQST